MPHTLPDLAPLPEDEREHVAIVGSGFIGLCSALGVVAWITDRLILGFGFQSRDPDFDDAA